MIPALGFTIRHGNQNMVARGTRSTGHMAVSTRHLRRSSRSTKTSASAHQLSSSNRTLKKLRLPLVGAATFALIYFKASPIANNTIIATNAATVQYSHFFVMIGLSCGSCGVFTRPPSLPKSFSHFNMLLLENDYQRTGKYGIIRKDY